MAVRLRDTLLTGIMVIGVLFLLTITGYAASATYTYDEMNRLIRAEYPDGTIIDYYYDEVGSRISRQQLETTPPTTSASPAGGYYNTSQSVTLSCDDGQGSGCDKIYYTTDGTTPTPSSPVYSSPVAITPTATLKFFAKDLAGNSESIKTEIYTLDTTPPTGTIIINSGASSTSSPNVNLTLTCSDTGGCSQMQFSNDNVTYSSAEAYATSKAWTLTAWDGNKTVYVKFKDSAGNWCTSPYLDAIVLNNDPPNPPIKIGQTGYTTLQDAYNAIGDGSTIKCQAIRFIESLTVNRNITVTLEGGYDSGFTSNTGGQTSIKGMITTTSGGGKITITNFMLEQ
jgi:YD repeat-containing protein